MRTFRSLLSNRRNSASGSAARPESNKQMVEVLERRVLLSAAVHHALSSANPVMHPAFISPLIVGTTVSQTNMGIAPGQAVTIGSTINFTITVSDPSSAGIPTGNVDITDNGVLLNGGNTMLDPSGHLFFSVSSLTAGTHNITATYQGDPTYAVSSAGPVAIIVDSLTVSGPSSAAFGAPITFTANVVPAAAAGTVTFFADGVQFSTPIAVTTGMVTSPAISTLSGGPHTITATFNATDPTTYGSPLNSNSFPVNITGAPSTTTLNSPTAMSTFGTPVTFTATVAPAGATGTVTFFSNGVAIPGSTTTVTAGTAMFTTTVANPLAAGVDSITAVYSGDATFNTSTSAAFTETVTPANTSTTLSVLPGNTVTVGTSLFFTATVSPLVGGLPAPTGTVTFEDGGVAIGAPVTLVGGTATSPAITSLGVGTHNITAVYTPAADYNTSTSVMTVETVNQGMPTVTVTSSNNPSPLGGSVTFTATVAGVMGAPTPTATVTFMDGMTVLPLGMNVMLVGGVATYTTSTLTVGPHSITVSYSGDVNYLPALTAAPLIQNVGLGATITTLNSMPASPVPFLTTVTFNANVMPQVGGGPALTGTITFEDNGVPLPVVPNSTVTVNAMGNATFVTASLSVGPHVITAVYSGDANYAPSTSVVVNYTIGVATSMLTLTSAQGTISLGGTTTLTATILPSLLPPIGGTVTFLDNGVAISDPANPVTLVNGVATFTYTGATLGSGASVHNLTAIYSGNGSFASSTSNTVPESVIGTSSLTTLMASFNTIAVGASDTFSVIVSAPTTGLPTPTGTITFTENGNTLAVVTLVNGTATLTSPSAGVPALALGNDTIVAAYSGDSNFGPSLSNAVTIGVFPITSNTSVTSLISDTDTIAAGGTVDFTATVVPGLGVGIVPAGTVTFYDGILPLSAPVTLDSTGVAKLTSALPTGNDNIVAIYSGISGGYSMSASPPLNENVGIGTRAATLYNTNLGVTSNAVAFGVPVTITATVSPTITGGPSPANGTVTFANGRTILKTLLVQTDGTASYTVSLPAGTNSITAIYSGGAALSTSAPMVITVASSAIPTLGLTVLPATAVAGGSFNVKVPVVVTNGSNAPKLHGKFTFNIYADTSSTLDGNQVLLKTMTIPGTLLTGQARIFTVNLKSLPANLTAGAYFILAQMIDPTGGANVAATPTTVTVAAAVVTPVATLDVITPGSLSLGTNASILVTVTNNGNSTANGPLTITLSPSDDGATAFGGVVFATYSLKSISMPVGKPRTFRLHFKVKNALTPGMYLPLVSVSLAGSSTTVAGATQFTFS